VNSRRHAIIQTMPFAISTSCTPLPRNTYVLRIVPVLQVSSFSTKLDPTLWTDYVVITTTDESKGAKAASDCSGFKQAAEDAGLDDVLPIASALEEFLGCAGMCDTPHLIAFNDVAV